MEQANVTYLGHSAWAVETPQSYYVFDYDKPAKDKGLSSGGINLGELQGKPAIFFSSHRHGDHYSMRLNKAVSGQANMKFVVGGFKPQVENTISMQARQSINIGNVSVTTADSTDEGVCYLVSAPGLTVFHSGDLANWPENDETPVNYFDEIDYIASKSNGVDIAFIPVSTFDGYQDPCLLEGALYAIKKLNPTYVFPMHANGREEFYKSFAKHAAENGVGNNIVCMEKPGGSWAAPAGSLG